MSENLIKAKLVWADLEGGNYSVFKKSMLQAKDDFGQAIAERVAQVVARIYNTSGKYIDNSALQSRYIPWWPMSGATVIIKQFAGFGGKSLMKRRGGFAEGVSTYKEGDTWYVQVKHPFVRMFEYGGLMNHNMPGSISAKMNMIHVTRKMKRYWAGAFAGRPFEARKKGLRRISKGKYWIKVPPRPALRPAARMVMADEKFMRSLSRVHFQQMAAAFQDVTKHRRGVYLL